MSRFQMEDIASMVLRLVAVDGDRSDDHAAYRKRVARMKISQSWALVPLFFVIACEKPGIDHEGWLRISGNEREGARVSDYMNGGSIIKNGDKVAFWMETVSLDKGKELQVLLQSIEVDCKSKKFKIVKIVGADAEGKVLTDRDDVTPLISLVPGSPISVAAKFACEGEDSGLISIHTMPLADANALSRGDL